MEKIIEKDDGRWKGAGAITRFPPVFLQWLEKNGVDQTEYEHDEKALRYFRIPKGADVKVETIQESLGISDLSLIQRVRWIKGEHFFSIPDTIKLVSAPVYKQGVIQGIDVSSGVAVAAMDIRAGDHCLDLCCAPGMKLCMMADYSGATGSVTGVDISVSRLSVCRSIVKKHKLPNVDLYLADGQTFALQPCYNRLVCAGQKKRKRRKKNPTSLTLNEKPQLFHSQALYDLADPDTDNKLYDRVLVDAECTHDGSVKHIRKYDQWGWDKFESNFLDPQRIDHLDTLQKQLLLNGFERLKPNGRLVYSTCSFATAQNEAIVEWLLDNQPSAVMLPINLDGAPVAFPQNPKVKDAIKFSPKISGTSGFFCALITKKEMTD